MGRRFSLSNPADGHLPDVGRTQTGMTSIRPSRPVYGTTLRCSCDTDRGDGRPWRRSRKVSNYAPSAGGRHVAQRAYVAHLHELGLCDADGRPPAPLSPPQTELLAEITDSARGVLYVSRHGRYYRTVTILVERGLVECCARDWSRLGMDGYRLVGSDAQA